MDFMEQLAQKFSQGTRVLSHKTDEILEITEMKINIKNMEDEIEEAKLYIGEVVYKYFQNQRIPMEEIQQKCREIQKMYYEINRLKARVSKLRGLKYCSHCGDTVDDDVNYCSKCGTRI